jgi:glycosyltransferase involved in cell wall biosynthesis
MTQGRHPSDVWRREKPSFGFVSTRLAGTDGVSLETAKWVEVLQSKGCKCYFMAGQLDTDPDASHLVPEAFFHHPEILEVQNALFVEKSRTSAISRRVDELKARLKKGLEEFHRRFGFDVLVVQNALAIPMNIPLGLAITEFIYENDIPVIAHHHDFAWERQRFNSPAAMDYLRWAFPPVHPRIRHVVINSLGGHQLSQRTGESWTLVPNVLDFKNMPPGIDDYTADFREAIGVDDDHLLILQPTRVVFRKGIETAIELVSRLHHPKATLVITHESGDEGYEYQRRIEEFATFMNVDLRIVADRIGTVRGTDADGNKIYSLWDAYPHADLVTYPSTYEGYGNAFVEAVYFRKPVIVNRYSIFEADIEPKGFDVIAISDFITEEVIADVHALMDDKERLQRMVEKNYLLGWQYLSYEMLEERLEAILIDIYGS